MGKGPPAAVMPDLFAWALCGAQACETTIASTSQLLDPRSQSWSQQVLSAFHIPQELFAPLVKSGTVVGEYQGAKVIAAAGHDTQCAVAALPAPEKDAAFLSCGTWSLLGCELEEPSSRSRAGCWASPTRLAPMGR